MYIYGGVIFAIVIWVAVLVYSVRKGRALRAEREERETQARLEALPARPVEMGGDLSGSNHPVQVVEQLNVLRASMGADAQATLDRVRAADQRRIRELEGEQRRLERQVAAERERANRRADPFGALMDQMLDGARLVPRPDPEALLREMRANGTTTTTTTTTVRRNGRPAETTTSTPSAPAPTPPPAPPRSWYDRLRDPWPTTNESPTDPPTKKT